MYSVDELFYGLELEPVKSGTCLTSHSNLLVCENWNPRVG